MQSTTRETYTGQKVDLAHPDPKSINIEDIAWHLARIARYNGATRSDNVYSVAQHCVLVLNRVRSQEPAASQSLLLTALLHNAHVAYIGDVISPMGQLLDLRLPLQRLKSRMQNAIYTGLLKEMRFGGQKFVAYLGPVIPAADKWAASYESYHLLHSRGNWHTDKVFLEEEFIMRNVIVWSPEQARSSFLNHYRDLSS